LSVFPETVEAFLHITCINTFAIDGSIDIFNLDLMKPKLIRCSTAGAGSCSA